MALSITQNPAIVSLAQSPIIFTVAESSSALLTSASFQYVGNLYYWTGSLTNSGSIPEYTLIKYPNTSNVGIFDLNRIINATLTDLAFANTSNVKYYAMDFYTQYYTGTTYVTGSHVKSSTYKALDGYGIFQEDIGEAVYNLTQFWPIMTDGPATQSVLIDDLGYAGIYTGFAGTLQPSKVTYTSNVGTADYTLTGTTSTSGQIDSIPIAPAQAGFPLTTLGLEWYSLQAYDSLGNDLGNPIRFDVVCQQKYPNVRIMWKNRFGQFDYYSFYMVNRQSFQTEKRTYQPQLGTWEGSSLSYQKYDSGVLNYVADSKQSISVNSWWLSEQYNDIIKELLVSDEIYWIYDQNNAFVRPLTIATQNITFKTGVVDHLIQYQFDFNYGQAYKLII